MTYIIIQLAGEACKNIVLEALWQNISLEFLWILVSLFIRGFFVDWLILCSSWNLSILKGEGPC